MEDKIKYLIELLDDEDERNASLAMAALLNGDKQSLSQCLRSLQESENPRLRRRVHQLETAFHARQKRQKLGRKLERSGLSLFDGCIQLHLLWFDNDLAECVKSQWRELVQKFQVQAPDYYFSAKEFMLAEHFEVAYNDELVAELYSIGVAIDEHFGSDVILAVLAGELMRSIGVRSRIIRRKPRNGKDDYFGILLQDGSTMFFPGGELDSPEFVIMEDREVLRYIAAMLLLCATATDSYRYVYTISHALLADDRNILPYPYNTER